MKFLIDENMPSSFCEILKSQGYEAIHVYDVSLNNSPDSSIVEFAIANNLVIITNDLDFSRLIAISKVTFPSVITFRFSVLNIAIFKEVMQLNLEDLIASLQNGALITINDKNIRIQSLPIK